MRFELEPYYKQLQRLLSLKNDLKEALKQLEFSRTHKSVLEAENQRLKAENEELKIKLLQQNEVNTLMTNLPWNDDPCGICESKQNYEHLKRALEDVREIAKEQKEICKIEGNCIDNRLCSTCFLGSGIELADDILDKVNEVLK